MREVQISADEVAVIHIGGMSYRLCVASSGDAVLLTARATDETPGALRAGELTAEPGENGAVSLELRAPLIAPLPPQIIASSRHFPADSLRDLPFSAAPGQVRALEQASTPAAACVSLPAEVHHRTGRSEGAIRTPSRTAGRHPTRSAG